MKFTSAALFALGASAAVAQPAPVQPISGTLLTVAAAGESRRTPDLATVAAGVVTQSATAAEAMRDNAARMQGVIAALRRAGLAERDIRTTQISLAPQYRYAENQPQVITGYQASNTVTVRFRDIGKAGTVLDALVSSGANQISGPELGLDAPAAAMDEARRDAIGKARARADLYADAAGLKVKRIVSISEEIGQEPRPLAMRRMSAMEQSAPATAILPGEESVIVSVAVQFELQ